MTDTTKPTGDTIDAGEARRAKGIVIIASEPEWKDDDHDTLMDHLEAFAFNANSYDELVALPERNEVRAELRARLAERPNQAVARGDSVTISRDIAYRAARACDYEGSRLFKNPKYRVASKEWHECAEHLRAALTTPTETTDAMEGDDE